MTELEMERLRRIEELFDGALEIPAGATREAWLEEQCATDAGMLAEARRLLNGHERVIASVPPAADTLPTFGPWQAIRLLGRGGMGIVYLAERADGAFRMSAAVKVVPLALASPDIEDRFRRERQFLASLAHPKIARLIDGGVTPQGLPYLVMEYVDGTAIDKFCDEHKLDKRARIGLMRQVLEALIYVHGQQVMHRDIKASNILVDPEGNAKLLDFGTARLVDASGDSAITKSGVFAYTPNYASPEQVQGKPLTFASDLYSAGVLLYHLLNGRAPFEINDSFGASKRAAEPAASGLDAPIDAVLGKALRKNPAERYASAAEMDADLERYLNGLPVRARQPRRFTWWWVVACCILLAVVGGGVAWMLLRLAHRDSRVTIAVLPLTNATADPADQYFADGLTDEIVDSLGHLKNVRVIPRSEVLQVSGSQKPDASKIVAALHATHVIDGSVERMGGRVNVAVSLMQGSTGVRLWTNEYRRNAADVSEMEANLTQSVGSALGLTMATRAVSQGEHVPPVEAHDSYLKARYEERQANVEDNARAQTDFRRAIEIDPNYALAYSGLAAAIWNENIWAGKSPVPEERRKAEELWQKALQINPSLVAAHSGLAIYAMQYDWDWKRAERELQAALAAGDEAIVEENYASLCLILGRRAEADKHVQRARELDPDGLGRMANRVNLLTLASHFPEARRECENWMSRNPKALAPRLAMAGLLSDQGETNAALRTLQSLPQDNPRVQMAVAQVKARSGDRAGALRLLLPLEENAQKTRMFMYDFAVAYAAMGDAAVAVQWMERSMDAREGPAVDIRNDPDLAKVQNDPAFRALKKRMNLDW